MDWDQPRQQSVEVTQDGPYRVTGSIPLTGDAGKPVAHAEGSSKEHYALCRCGHSQNKPFCSGMQWYVGFRDPAPPPGHQPTVFEWAGGNDALTRMARRFYEKHVPADPLLAPLFADMPQNQPQRLAAWLAEALGGPATEGADSVSPGAGSVSPGAGDAAASGKPDAGPAGGGGTPHLPGSPWTGNRGPGGDPAEPLR